MSLAALSSIIEEWSSTCLSSFFQFGIKGSLTRDFQLQFLFMNQCPPRPLSILLGAFQLFSKIRRENREWMFINGDNDTGYKLFGSVNDTADKFIGGVDTGD